MSEPALVITGHRNPEGPGLALDTKVMATELSALDVLVLAHTLRALSDQMYREARFRAVIS